GISPRNQAATAVPRVAMVRIQCCAVAENEEKVVVEEEAAPQAEIPPIENNFYFDICGTDPEPPTTQ
ncbi:hypothetical protein ACJX0J_016183, partial [Zea mays]